MSGELCLDHEIGGDKAAPLERWQEARPMITYKDYTIEGHDGRAQICGRAHLRQSASLTGDELRAAGHALYGPRWITDLARALECHPRSVRRWAAGSWPVPDGVAHDIALLVSTRMAELATMGRPKASRAAPPAKATGAPLKPPTAGPLKPTGPPQWMIDEERL